MYCAFDFDKKTGLVHTTGMIFLPQYVIVSKSKKVIQDILDKIKGNLPIVTKKDVLEKYPKAVFTEINSIEEWNKL